MKKIYRLIGFVAVAVLLQNCATKQIPGADGDINFYVGTSSGDESEGIYIFNLNLNTGVASKTGNYGGILNPGYLTVSADGKNLYAAHGIKGEKEGQVSSFAIDKKSGSLKLLSRQSSKGRGICYVTTDVDGNALAANYSSGSISLLPTDKKGMLSTASSTKQHAGSSVNAERQKGPHAHYIEQGIAGVIYAADLGTDKIMLYKKKGNQLVANDPPYIEMHAGAGPRHIDFHPNGRYLYVLNELEGSVTGFEYNPVKNNYSRLQTLSSLPADFVGFNKSADIHIHPSGKYLYASNRGDMNSIAAYHINQNTGKLTLVEIENEAIAWPRNFAISPDGKHLLCANRDDDSITFYQIDTSNGHLSYTGNKVSAPKPICVKFER